MLGTSRSGIIGFRTNMRFPLRSFLRSNFYVDAYVVEVEIAIKTSSYRSPSGDAGASFVSRADIARAAAVVLTSEGHVGKVYDMTGPSVVAPAVFAKAASQLSGWTIRYEPITWDELAGDYRGRGMPDEYVDLSVNLERMIATHELASVSDDIARLTGEPAQDFASFVRKTLA